MPFLGAVALVKQIDFWAHSILFAVNGIDIGLGMIFVRNETEREQGVGIVDRKETDAIETFTDTLAQSIRGGSTNHGKWQITNVSALFSPYTHTNCVFKQIKSKLFTSYAYILYKQNIRALSIRNTATVFWNSRKWSFREMIVYFDKISNENINAVALSSMRFT